MWFTVIARWEGGLAHYNIFQQSEDLFQAKLMKYDGRPDKIAPSDFFLSKGNNSWTGSINDKVLLEQLGNVIDTRIRGRLYNQLQQGKGNSPDYRQF